MAETALKLVLLGQDRSAGKALDDVGKKAGKTGGMLGKLGGMGKAAMLGAAGAALAAIPAVVDFGKESLAAFADAEKSQRQLEDAYKRFPRVASVNIESLRKLNDAIQRKTGADGDDIAAGQAVLARYKLTGQQMKQMTPLLVDYATRTGKDIPAAAGVLGKALMGSARATKELGVNVKLGKDPAKNYALVMDALKSSVGGYAESLPDAERKQKILAASFGDLQESVGEKLQPALLGLVDMGQGVLDWLEQTPEVAEGAAAMWDLLGMAMEGLGWLARKTLAPALAMVLGILGMMTDGVVAMLDALSTVPGFGWAKGAADKLRTVSTGLGKVASAARALSKDPPKVKLDDRDVKSKTAAIEKKIRDLNKQKAVLKTRGDTKGIRDIESRINKLKRQKHEVRMGVGLKKSGPQRVRIDMRPGSGFLRFAASGTPYAASGALTWVGEQGPELMRLPTGSRVYSNAQSRAITAQSQNASSAGGDVVIIQAPPGAPRAFALLIEDELAKLKASRGRGGKLRF